MKRGDAARRVLFFSVLAFFGAASGNTAIAHVSADSMPDSVAEVEYRIYLEFKPNDVVVLNKLGMVYYRLNKLPDAVREFSKVLRHDPDNYDALDGMGLVRAAQQEYDEAVRLHKQAIAINSGDMMTYYHLGCSDKLTNINCSTTPSLRVQSQSSQTSMENYSQDCDHILFSLASMVSDRSNKDRNHIF